MVERDKYRLTSQSLVPSPARQIVFISSVQLLEQPSQMGSNRWDWKYVALVTRGKILSFGQGTRTVGVILRGEITHLTLAYGWFPSNLYTFGLNARGQADRDWKK